MPTRTSSDRKADSGVARSRRVSLLLAALVAALGLLWLGTIYADYREGAWVEGTFIFEEAAWAVDFDAYIGASERIIETGSPYSADLIAGEFEPGPAELYYYAPPLSVALIPFTELSFADSSAIWWALRVIALLLACALMPISWPLRAAAFAVVAFSLPGLKDSVIGNVSLLLVLPLVVTWRSLDRPIGSLVMAAAISVRPSLGLYFFWQLLRRQWSAAVWTAVGGVALVVLALPIIGIDGHLDYIAVLRNLSVPSNEAVQNRDLGALLASLGDEDLGMTVGRLASVVVSGVALVASLRREREVGYMVVICGSLLVVPLLWDHYLASLVVPAAFLAHRLWPPLILLPLASWLPFLSPVLVIVTMLLTFLVREERSEPEPSAAVAPA